MLKRRLKMLKLLKQKQTTNSEFSKLKQEFDKVNNAATEQKSQTYAINLIDDILGEDNAFNNANTEEIWIEGSLFDYYDTQAIKNISKEIIKMAEPIEITTMTDDNDEFNPIETITIEDDIDITSDDGIAIDAPKKVKIITTSSNQLCVKKTFLCQKLRGILKKAAGWLKKTGFLCTDDLETIDYNNDTIINDLDDVEIINYNNDKNINDLDNVNLKKTLRAQMAAKNIDKNIRI